jgi:uncharacterized membrane protein
VDSKRLTEKQRELLSKTIVDIGKLIFAALVLAQVLSEKPLNKLLFVSGFLLLAASIIIGVFIAGNEENKKRT